MRTEIYTKDGLVSVTDLRVLEEAMADKIADVHFHASLRLESSAPAYKQANAALGIYDTEKCEAIKATIQECRSQCDKFEAAILACKTLEELDALQTEFEPC